MSAINCLPEITERIVNASQPEKIVLFGSHARGDFDLDSDLDLLVVIRGVKHLWAEATRLRGALRRLLVPVDIVAAAPDQLEWLGDVPGMVYRTALKEGKVVYERAGARHLEAGRALVRRFIYRKDYDLQRVDYSTILVRNSIFYHETRDKEEHENR